MADDPRQIVALALHREHCGERSPQATHPADWDCHLIDADAALDALTAAGYSLLAPEVKRCPGCGTPISPQYAHCIDCERLPGWHAGREVGNVAS